MSNNTATQAQQLTNDLRHTIDINNSKANAQIKIRLNDECKNGHQDFSINATIWEIGKVRNDRNMISGGCCHDEILKLRPDLQIFVNLHLCDYSGVPMHAVENGFYHLCNGFNNTKPNAPTFKAEFCEYYRLTPSQFDILAQSENKLRYAVNLEKLGILAHWKEEADKAILLLEEMTGKKFLIDSVKKQYTAPTAQQIAEEDAKDKEGYYTPAKIQERKEQEAASAKAKQYEKIAAEMNKTIAKAQREHEVKKAVLDAGLPLDNFIYYTHSNTGSFNWKNYGTRITKDEFSTFLHVVQLDNIAWECK
jgi:hypothetical protein